MAVPNNGPLIAGVGWGLCIFCGAFLALRLYAKLSRKQRLWWDDYILITSWVLLLVETVLAQAGVILGFGKHNADISHKNLAIITLGMSVGSSISCFASTLSKISFGVTLLRLTSSYTRTFVWFCIITLFLVMLPSALATWVSCRPVAKAWNSSIEGTCIDMKDFISYGIFNAAWCVFVDFALALLPWKLIWGLQLQWKEKVGIGIAMSMGLLAGMCAIVKGLYLVQLDQADFFYNGKDVTIWTAVETATAIVGASIPVLRVFIKHTINSYFSDQSKSHDLTSTYRSRDMPLSSRKSQRPRSTDKSGLVQDIESQVEDDDTDSVEYMVDENGKVFIKEREGVAGRWANDGGRQVRMNHDQRTSPPNLLNTRSEVRRPEEIDIVIAEIPPRSLNPTLDHYGRGIVLTRTVNVQYETDQIGRAF